MVYYVIVWKHDTMKLADTRLYMSEADANAAIKAWLHNDPASYTTRMLNICTSVHIK